MQAVDKNKTEAPFSGGENFTPFPKIKKFAGKKSGMTLLPPKKQAKLYQTAIEKFPFNVETGWYRKMIKISKQLRAIKPGDR